MDCHVRQVGIGAHVIPHGYTWGHFLSKPQPDGVRTVTE
jgi:hypothetical protein